MSEIASARSAEVEKAMRTVTTIEDVNEALAADELQDIEFKEGLDQGDIEKTIVALANDYHDQGGGTIVLGVSQKERALKGLQGSSDECQLRIADVCRGGAVVPPVVADIRSVPVPDGGFLVIVAISQGERRPYRARGICYIRVGSSTRQATFDEELSLRRRSRSSTFDKTAVNGCDLEAIDFPSFQAYLRERMSEDTRVIDERVPEQIMVHLGFAQQSGERLTPTAAAVFLFGKEPQKWFPNSSIEFIRFDGKDEADDILTRNEVRGRLGDIQLLCQNLVEANMARASVFGERSWRREDIVEYPYGALREAILNAIVHRDYENQTARTSIKMFDDRIEIISPGGLYGIVNPGNFGTGVVDHRNPEVAEALRTLGYVERVGRGIPLIKKVMQQNASPEPRFEFGAGYVRVVLPAHRRYPAIRYFEKGVKLREQGYLDEAREYFRLASEIEPDFTELYNAWANLEADAGNVVVARQLFRRLVETAPGFEQAYARWAQLESRLGNSTESREILRLGTEKIPRKIGRAHV